MKKSKLVLALTFSLLGVFVLSGCGSQTVEVSAPETVEYIIDMSEFSFSPTSLEFSVGQQVTLRVKNVGMLEHEIMIGRKTMNMDGMPSGYEVDMFEFAGVEPVVVMPEGHEDDTIMNADEHAEETDEHGEDTHTEAEDEDHSEDMAEDMDMDGEHGHAGFMVTVQPSGEEATITFTVTEEMIGEWEIGCFFGGHYDAGMQASLIISG